MNHNETVVTPVIGFSDESLANQHRDGLQFKPGLVGHANDSRFYVRNHGLLQLDTELLSSPGNWRRQDAPDRPTYIDSHGIPTRSIPGGFNTLLVHAGKREVTFPSGTRHETLKRISFEPRDCYVVWRDFEGSSFERSPVSVRQTVTRWEGAEEKEDIIRSEAIATRKARGVLFARRRHVMAGTHISGADGIRWLYQTYASRVMIEVLDRDTGRPDALRLRVAGGLVGQGLNGEYESFAFPTELDQSWHEMLTEAQAGFGRECTDCTPELEAQYENVLKSARESRLAINQERERHSGGRRNGRYHQ